MKMIYKLTLTAFMVLLLFSCKKDSLSPLPGWEDGVTAFGKMESGIFKANEMDTSKVIISLSWNNYGKAVTVNKMELYVHWVENYYDSTSQQEKQVEHFGLIGKTDPSLVITDPKLRTKYQVTITPDKVYNLFKDAKNKYNGPTAVNVFANPEINRSDPKNRFRVGDSFYVTWYLYATDGRVFKSWSISIENNEVLGANTSVNWSVTP